MTIDTSNPLLAPMDQLMDYQSIRPEQIEPAITHLLEKARKAVQSAADPALPATWEAVITPLDDIMQPLWRAWTIVGHLKSVVSDAPLREAFNQILGPVTEFGAWVGLHEGLYQQYLRLKNNPDFVNWSPARQRVIELSIRDFLLSGVALQGEKRERFAQIAQASSEVAQKFSENILDANDAWSLTLDDESRLQGLPDDVIARFRQQAQTDKDTANGDTADEVNAWKITLKMPDYLPVMQYAKDRELRQTLYRAYATLASDQGDTQYDNTEQIERSLALRAEKSALLDFEHFAAMQLETRMADDAPQVLNFLRDLAQRALPFARRDLKDLQAFAQSELGLDTLEPWDVGYASEQLRQARYDYSEEEIKPYLPQPRVIDGLFKMLKQLFDLTFEPTSMKLWHNDAQAFKVFAGNQESLGYLIMDLTAREGKQAGAWVNQERDRRRVSDHLQTPIVYLTCNFAPAAPGEPARLTHDDLITLFHEMGHALHALLGQVDEPGASAFSAVEWDAIELPSQFMENFCWEYPVLETLTGHVETGAPLPKPLFDKLLAARNFQSGMQTVRQIEFAMFDMLLHNQPKGLEIGDVMQTLQSVRDEVAVIHPPAWHRFPHAFSHLFAGGYAAGYYSYKWAEVLSADAYAAFEETGNVLDTAMGERYRQEILAVGGLRPAAESFRAFRGRDAQLDALLRHGGMTALTDQAHA